MAKSKLIVPGGDNELVDHTGESFSTVPGVAGVTPTGSQVLIEFLTAQELSGVTSIFVSDKTETKVTLQGYVKAVGPSVKCADWGFKVGDRVLISGTGVMSPNHDGSKRDRFLMEPHAVKAVLTEAV